MSPNIIYVFLIIIYLAAVAWYVYYSLNQKKKYRREGSSKRRRKKSRNKAGKKCPDCSMVIDRRRTVCQHCGHEFELDPGVEPHPDEASQDEEREAAS